MAAPRISQLVVPRTCAPTAGFTPGLEDPPSLGNLIPTGADWNRAALPAWQVLWALVFGQSLWV